MIFTLYPELVVLSLSFYSFSASVSVNNNNATILTITVVPYQSNPRDSSYATVFLVTYTPSQFTKDMCFSNYYAAVNQIYPHPTRQQQWVLAVIWLRCDPNSRLP